MDSLALLDLYIRAINYSTLSTYSDCKRTLFINKYRLDVLNKSELIEENFKIIL